MNKSLRLAIAQLNPTVGDVPGNTRLVLEAIDLARAEGAQVLATSELAIIGYPPRDLLLREGVIEACEDAVKEIAVHTADMYVFVGYPRRVHGGLRGCRNSVAVCHAGEIVHVYDKRLLPGYDVFDEDRYFDPGEEPCVIEVAGSRIGLLICEDLWRAQDVDSPCRYPIEPVEELAALGCDALLTMNATPFVMGKYERHVKRMREVAKRLGVPVVFINQVGANDDLIFDGRSFALDANGEAIGALSGFDIDIQVIDLLAPKPTDSNPWEFAPDPMHELFEALVLSVKDYCRKTGHSRMHMGLSGGIDSALSAAIACRALGPENVHGVTMPSKYSSTGSISDSEQLATNLGMADPPVIPIRDTHDAMFVALDAVLGDVSESITDQNIQARLRGMILMALSNANNTLVLSTSNKSEIAVGYSTIYGDMCGAVTVLGDVMKTRCYELARWVNEHHETLGFDVPPIPENSITKPPSAELLHGQTDQDTLPPYEVLDEIIVRFIDRDQSIESIVEETGLDVELVEMMTKLIDRAQYKRDQAAVIPKVTPRAFGRGRVMPIVMKGLPVRVVK
jgi:NAD+ synthase (glutamine-hydrolysing)